MSKEKKQSTKEINSALFAKLESANSITSPAPEPMRQKIVPVIENKRDSETKFTLWINSDLHDDLEDAVNEDKRNRRRIGGEKPNKKLLITEALIMLLRSRGKDVTEYERLVR